MYNKFMKIDVRRVLKTVFLWVSAVYMICFAGVALFPKIRSGFMKYGLHTEVEFGEGVFSVGTFFWGLLIWNVIAIISAWLFALIYNRTK